MPDAMTNMPARGPNAAEALDGDGNAETGEGAPDVSGLGAANGGSAEQMASTGAQTPVQSAEVPAGDYCAEVADWDPAWVQFEEEVLRLVNEMRSQPADCGEEGPFAAAAPLRMEPLLRCSARLHSLDMFTRDFFDHTNPDGIDPFQRMSAAGFSGGGGGENIALGQTTPEQVMQAWMDSDGHCANVMRAAFDEIGVGYHPGAGRRGAASNYWTQNFGAPPFMQGSRGGRTR